MKNDYFKFYYKILIKENSNNLSIIFYLKFMKFEFEVKYLI